MKKILFNDIQLTVEREAILIESKRHLKILSSAPVNGGLKISRRILNFWIPKEHYNNPEGYLMLKCRDFIDDNVVCLMTGADLTKVGIVEKTGNQLRVIAIVTAGVSNSTAVTDGYVTGKGGTINTIVLVDRDLTESCMINVLTTATEAKCKALYSLDVRSTISQEQATGTSSDAILVASLGEGKSLEYAGSATELGWLVGLCVEEATKKAIIAHDKLLPERPLIRRLRERGIFFEDLISTAMELYIPHYGVLKNEAKKIFERCLSRAMEDINVTSLVMAAIRMNDDGKRGLIPNMDGNHFQSDPVELVADEILGISISMYIAGYNGLFEFYRFDRKKPGILRKLPPFIDDAIGGLLAGASSKMYEIIGLKINE